MHGMSPLQKRGWLAALGCMASVLLAGCDSGATLMLPAEQAEMPASPQALSPEGVSPNGLSPPASDVPSGIGDAHGTAPLPSDSGGPGAMQQPEAAAPDDDGARGAEPGAPGASPDRADDGSDDPDDPPGDPPPDERPPDGPAPGDPAPDEPDEPEPIPPDPSEPEPVDEQPSPPRQQPPAQVDPGSDLPEPGSDLPLPGDEPTDGQPSSGQPSSSQPSSSNPADDNPPGDGSPGAGDVVGPESPQIPGGLPSFRISVIGSSTASGFGASSGGSAWASLLEASLIERAATPVTVSNLAVGGYTALDLAPGSGMAGSIDDAIREKPDLILVALAGSNDLDGTLTTEFFISELVTLRDTAKAAGIPTFFMGTLPKNFTDDNRQLLVDFDRAMASEFGACWIPGVNEPYAPCYIHVFESLADASLGLAPEFDSGDGQHPNDAGHALLFKAADAIIKPYVCSKTRCR